MKKISERKHCAILPAIINIESLQGSWNRSEESLIVWGYHRYARTTILFLCCLIENKCFISRVLSDVRIRCFLPDSLSTFHVRNTFQWVINIALPSAFIPIRLQNDTISTPFLKKKQRIQILPYWILAYSKIHPIEVNHFLRKAYFFNQKHEQQDSVINSSVSDILIELW